MSRPGVEPTRPPAVHHALAEPGRGATPAPAALQRWAGEHTSQYVARRTPVGDGP